MGYYRDYDPATDKEVITETFTCPHHNTIHPRRMPSDQGGARLDIAMCRKCTDNRGQPRPVCDKCVVIESSGGDMHERIEVKLEKIEKHSRLQIESAIDRARFLRSLGL